MITPVSQAEFVAQAEGRLPAMEEVAEGVWCLPLRIAPGRMPFSLSYLVRDAEGGVHVVDPGWELDANVDAIDTAVRAIAGRGARIASLVVTHLHPDHLGLAERLRQRDGAPVIFHRAEQRAQEVVATRASDPGPIQADIEAWGVPEGSRAEIARFAQASARPVVIADVLVDDDDVLPIPGRTLRVIHTPGHTPGHICLVDEAGGLLYTGDHILPTVAPGVGLGGPTVDNPLEAYLDGLAAMRAYDDLVGLPGHGYRFRGIAERATEIARRHLGRSFEVAQAREADPDASVWEIASRLSWSRGWENLARHHIVSALRQTAMHVRLIADGRLDDMRKAWGEDVPHPRPSA
ncbi:MBL fold metallo-hydrolase [Microbacterium gallinarum]|uniref:MBL fold metallo-hydrolase n=1 Tax=Microbacterium gallinarum TaxID=2762209 RepID=A0ABR8X0H5_9MICO|nr:MBL fold metallo-hydrolase [Microbacterium gallinarum]MBD8022755.1 MBL fold metallo-hydrolase [Microbacterium gallinarum]